MLKTLGCAPTAKINQIIACQSEGSPGDANSPVTLLEWHAPGGIPDVGFDGIVFLTKFPEPGVKQISLKACSDDACTTLTQNVTVQFLDFDRPVSGALKYLGTTAGCEDLQPIGTTVQSSARAVSDNGTFKFVHPGPKTFGGTIAPDGTFSIGGPDGPYTISITGQVVGDSVAGTYKATATGCTQSWSMALLLAT